MTIFTHNFSHTNFHTQLCHTFFRTTLLHTIFHRQLCHTTSFTDPLSHTTLSHTIFHTQTLSHTIFHTQLCHTPSFTHNFAWQAWHLVTSTFISRGRCGLVTSTSVSRGRRGTWSTGLALVARLGALRRPGRWATLRGRCGHLVTSSDVHRRFAWQAWHLGHWAGSGGALGRAGAFCVAGVALCDIHLRFAWHFAKHNSSHTTCLTSRSSTSFVFPSFPVPATTFVAHFWTKLTCGVIRSFNLTLRCGKSARHCGAKHISKSTCTKHFSVGVVLDVEMFKKWRLPWRQAHSQVKMLNAHHSRSTFGR